MAEAPGCDRLLEVSVKLLADAAFIFADPSPTPVGDDVGLLVARVAIQCDGAWELILAVEAGLGEELAANLLGVERETDEARLAAADAVGELANIFAGSLAVEFQGRQGDLAIGIPAVTAETGAALAGAIAQAARRLDLVTDEGGALAIALRGEGLA